MDDTITGLNRMMRGMNFKANFGYDVLHDCKTLPEAEAAIKKLHPEAQPDEYRKLRKWTEEILWEEIDYALNYRQEDHGEGPDLKTEEDVTRLNALGEAYRAYIATFLKADTEIYSLPIKGIGVSDVWWYYHVVLINKDGNTLFIYSTATD